MSKTEYESAKRDVNKRKSLALPENSIEPILGLFQQNCLKSGQMADIAARPLGANAEVPCDGCLHGRGSFLPRVPERAG